MTIFDRFSNFDQDWYRLSNICGQYRSISDGNVMSPNPIQWWLTWHDIKLFPRLKMRVGHRQSINSDFLSFHQNKLIVLSHVSLGTIRLLGDGFPRTDFYWTRQFCRDRDLELYESHHLILRSKLKMKGSERKPEEKFFKYRAAILSRR